MTDAHPLPMRQRRYVEAVSGALTIVCLTLLVVTCLVVWEAPLAAQLTTASIPLRRTR